MSSPDRQILAGNQPAQRFLAAAVAAGFFAAACLLAFMILIAVTVARVFIDGDGLAEIGPFLWLMSILLLGRAVLLWGREALSQRSASLLKVAIRARTLRRLFDLGPIYSHNRRGGELVSTVVASVEALDGYISGYRVSMFLAGLVPALVLLIVLWIDPATTLVLIFAGPMLILLMVFIGQQTRDLTERRHEDLNWMSAYFLDVLRGLPTLKMFGRSGEQATHIAAISQEFARSTLEVLRTAFQTTLVLEWASTAATAMVALEVSWRLMRGNMPFVDALSVLLLTPEFFLPLRQFAAQHHVGSEGKAAAKRIFEVIDTPEAVVPKLEGGSVQVPPRPFDVTFDDVHFAYGDRPALRGFSVQIPAGQTMALVGQTGAGKSTVAALLLRFVEQTSGTISAGGVPLNTIDRAMWRAQMAWVPQLPHLFHGTVADNIRLGSPTASLAEIVAAAQAAHADEFIRALPQGYDTPLGEEAARLSGGQRQRIALARAFLRAAPLVILDEATSHLDMTSEAQVREALARLRRGRTVLIIAHRLALAAEVDLIAVMSDGRVVAVGSHVDLLATSGYYRDLVMAYRGEMA